MTVLTVAGTALPDPAYRGYTCTWEELNKADRNTLGNLIKERITTKYTNHVEWKGLTYTQKNTVVSATNPNTFSVTFLSMMDDTFQSGTFYRGSGMTIEGYGKMTSTSRFTYYDVTMDLVEV